MNQPRAIFRKFCAILGGWVLLVLVAPAAGSELTATPTVGYNGLFPIHKWVPFHVLVENRGRDLGGTLEVAATSGSEYFRNVRTTTYAIPVELAAGARKRYRLTIRLDSFVHPLQVRLTSEGETVFLQTLDLRAHHSEAPLALVLDERLSLDFLPAARRRMRPVYLHGELFPDTWYAYDGAAVVVSNAPALKNLSQAQFSALRQWIEAGGYCVVSGDIRFSAYQEPRISQILPVEVTGLHECGALPSLKEFCGHEMTSPRAFILLRSRLATGTVLVHEGGLPIMAYRDMGRGRVLFLAFDHGMPPFSGWNGKIDLWDRILDNGPEKERPLSEPELLPFAGERSSLRFPSRPTLAWFLGVYCLSVYGALRHLRHRQTRRHTALLPLLGSVAFLCLAAHHLFSGSWRGQDPFFEGFAHVRSAGGDHVAKAHYRFGLWSPSGGTWGIALDPPGRPLVALADGSRPFMRPFDFVLTEKEKGQQIQVALDGWSPGLFEATQWIDLPLKARAALDSTGLVVQVENPTAYPLKDCRVVWKERLFSLGDVAAGARAIKRFPVPQAARDRTIRSDSPGTGPGVRPAAPATPVEEAVRALGLRPPPGQDEAILLAWSDRDIIPTHLVGRGAALGKGSLFEVTMTVDR